jgi:lysophospholipase L1-like esterase
MGDSIAWPRDGFVALLRERLRARQGKSTIEVVNAAVPGYTTLQERRFFERDLLVLKPDLVLLQYCLNDNHDFLHRLTPDGKWLITQEAKQALLAQGDGPLARLSRASYLLLELRRRVFEWRMKSPGRFAWEGREDFFVAWQAETWPIFEEHLKSMVASAAAIGAELAVVAVPYEPQLRDDLLELDEAYTLYPQRQLARITAEVGVPFLDLYSTFREHLDDDVYENDGIHLEPAGHEIVAERIERFLVDRQLVATH